MRVARVKAQAKVNLGLRVLPLIDSDGYHLLMTLFQRIDLSDDVVVRSGGTSRSLDVSGPRVPGSGLGPVEKNLAYRAAVAFVERRGVRMPGGFAIELTKNIPVGGGLGGGSADAGAVLRALNALAPTPLIAEELRDIAAVLGADVPFLAGEHATALGMGRGEMTFPCPSPPPAPVAIIVPDFGIATQDAYAWLDQENPPTELGGSGYGVGKPDIPAEAPDWDGLEEFGNNFEPVVEKRHPELRRYRESLVGGGAILARLAGSGSCVFGVFDPVSPVKLDEFDFARSAAPFRGDILHTRTSARVVEVKVLQ
jgi:4-diphosphocytidyl-2-C-methyl-D-erythritol kinase